MSIQDDIKSIDTGKAEFIGEGEWIKDSAYQVYKIEDRYVSLLVCDHQSKWIMDGTHKYIQESEAMKYVEPKEPPGGEG